MSLEITEELNFVPLEDVLKSYPLQIDEKLSNNIFVRLPSKIPEISDFSSNNTVIKIINSAILTLLDSDSQNVLCLGYSKSANDSTNNSLTCWHLNYATSVFKSRKWCELLRLLGDALSMFLLTECGIIEKINGKYVLIAGNIKNMCKNENRSGELINREKLFHKMTKIKPLDSQETLRLIYNEEIYYDKTDKMYKIKNDVLDSGENVVVKRKGFKIEKYQAEIKRICCWIEKCNRMNYFKVYFKYFERELNCKNFKNIIDCQVSQIKLQNFLFIIAKKNFSSLLDYHSFNVLKSKIKEFVTRNRYETLNKTELLRFFKIKKLRLFKDVKTIGREEFIRQTNVFANLLFFMFDRLFIPLVSTCFYSTEGFQNFKIFYFTRKAWTYFTRIHLREFLKRFDKRKKTNGVQYTPRCIPKKDGFRVIVNKSKRDRKGKSENMVLQSAYHVLAGEQKLNHGNSFIDYNQIFEEFIRYDFSSSFILKFDIKGCFDNIPHENLQAILIDFLKNDEYYVRRYNLSTKRGRYCITKKICISIDSSKKFSDIIRDKEPKSNELIWDDVYVGYKRKEGLVEEICKIIKENVITLGKEHYVQQKGIPQGSILSSILSSLYFQNLDASLFDKIVKTGKIFRYVDDFLVVSRSLDEMLEILSSLKLLEKDGVMVNYKKIESNFGFEKWLSADNQIQDLFQNVERVKTALYTEPDRNKFITYCGLKLCCRGFKINLNFERIEYSCAYSSVKPGQTTRYKVVRFCKKILKDIYFTRANTFKYQNVYDAFIFLFRKILNFSRKMDFVNIKFILSIVNHAKNLMRKQLKNVGTDVTEKKLKQIKNKALKDSGLKLFLQKIEISKSLKRQREVFYRVI